MICGGNSSSSYYLDPGNDHGCGGGNCLPAYGSSCRSLVIEAQFHTGSIRITYQEITSELGRSRGANNRILEYFSNTALISLGRGTLELIDKDELENLAVM